MTGVSDASGRPAGDLAGVADVRGVIADLATDWYGAGAKTTGDVDIRSRPWSIQIRPLLATSQGPVRLVVKIPLWDEAPTLQAALAAGPQRSTRLEFDTLVRIRDMVGASGDPGLAAVPPVAYLPELNAVVTELVPARSLREVLRSVRSRRSVARILGAVGRWLRLFHDTVGAAGDVDAGEEIERFWAPLAARLAEGDHPAALAAMPGLLRRRSGSIESTLRRAVLHGDLGPSNVLVLRSGAVAVIDPNGAGGPVALDPGKLIAAMRTGPLRLALGVPRRGARAAERALLTGYGDLDPAAVRLAIGVAVADRWIDLETQTTGVRRALLPAARRALRAEIIRAIGAEPSASDG